LHVNSKPDLANYEEIGGKASGKQPRQLLPTNDSQLKNQPEGAAHVNRLRDPLDPSSPRIVFDKISNRSNGKEVSKKHQSGKMNSSDIRIVTVSPNNQKLH
jgi:hypothetical protein